jgi:dihydropyrimidine dehydrogenase (NAD+) subunit PreT
MQFPRPTSKEQFDTNFAPIKPLMNDTEAYLESSRCLFCYDAPCVKACPTEIDIPLFIRQINTGNVEGSAKTIYDSNYFGYACGKVCPTEVLCEGACVFIEANKKPIEIGRLQSYATGDILKKNKKLYSVGESNNRRVAIIGAGPAGISCACELRMMGFDVDIYEAKEFPSGLTIYGVAPYKITNEEALEEMNYLQSQFGFNINYNSHIKTKDDLNKLEKDYDAIVIGIGLGMTKEIKISGEEMEGCFGAIEFIESVRMKQHNAYTGKEVVVLGGGNTSMDAASESARLGAENIVLVYRRSFEEMGAYLFEFELAKEAGVRSIFNAAPVEIFGNGKVDGIRFIKTFSENDSIKEIPESEFEINCDMVIKATGQEKMTNFLKLISGLETDKSGRIIVNEKFQTTNPKYFAAGDAVNGGKEVVNAVAEGKNAARGIGERI